MDEDEDDVHRKGLRPWPSSQVQLKQTETAGRPPASPSVMLPCPVHVEHTRFFYGSAGLLLLAPPSRSRSPDVVLRPSLRMMERAARAERSVETLIGQKLQLIGDQFYQEHMMHHRNQRNREPLWWRVALAVYTLLFGREAEARANRR